LDAARHDRSPLDVDDQAQDFLNSVAGGLQLGLGILVEILGAGRSCPSGGMLLLHELVQVGFESEDAR
jgi:hypothetical protein